MENETKKSKLTAKDILAKTGPGIIMAAAAVGTGTVTTSAILGARYEYGMIWMVILALFMRGIYMRSAYTAQVVLGMPILDCINKFYGKALCAIAGFVCAFGCVAYEVGNFSGSGISINLLFGLDWKIGGVIMSLVCLLFIFGRSILIITCCTMNIRYTITNMPKHRNTIFFCEIIGFLGPTCRLCNKSPV